MDVSFLTYCEHDAGPFYRRLEAIAAWKRLKVDANIRRHIILGENLLWHRCQILERLVEG